jgi:hypothetical protein
MADLANDDAAESIRAEISSPDPYVRRARATPLWVGSSRRLELLPYAVRRDLDVGEACRAPAFFWGGAWMFAIGGYVASRVAARALGGSGGGLSFMGVKLDSKGD